MNSFDIFQEAFEKVVELEGGFRLHKNPTEDEYTYAGIYRKAHPEWEGWEYVDKGETPPTQLVREFYYQQYWKPFDFQEIPDAIKVFLFDTAVNTGVRAATKLFQKALGVVADGIIGPKTLETVKDADDKNLLLKLQLLRVGFYLDLANKNPKKYAIYLRGWLNRVFALIG